MKIINLTFESLLKESSDFEIDRVKIIEKSQKLEKAVINNKDKLGIELNEKKPGGYYNFTGILEQLLKTNILSLEQKENLRFIRNMYSHSEYKLELLESNDFKEEYSKDKTAEGNLCVSHRVQMYYAKVIDDIIPLITSNA